ncbi:hypothetical protein KUTeg_021179 [Tegillarca granosa]|uniref:C1q domain-containing protein n=1 Tax=Tegillarca granosa TaxID=220873 RepID=A0ABQ9EE51_TEGGR|nr:hypothetical protein KUTeg_021179 [Tegillarca granosa]
MLPYTIRITGKVAEHLQLDHFKNIMQAKFKSLEKSNKIVEKRQVQEVIAPVAFTAALTPSRQILGQHQTIEYDKVITNLGNAYDPRHGHFTAPVKGLYLFSVTLMSSYGSNPNSLYAELVKNGVTIIPLYATNIDSDSTSATVLLTMNADDMIWVRSNTSPSQTIHGSSYDTFSGLLISKLQ